MAIKKSYSSHRRRQLMMSKNQYGRPAPRLLSEDLKGRKE